MKREWILGLAIACACGGRTTLDDGTGDASPSNDGGVILPDGAAPPLDGSTVPDAIVPPLDAGPPVDAGTGGSIACGNDTCDSNTQTCCVTFSGQNLNETCTAIGQCKNGGSFDCSSAASCPNGEVCCASFSQTKQGSDCQPACQGGFQNPQLCASSSECPQGQTCQSSPFGFKVCRP